MFMHRRIVRFAGLIGQATVVAVGFIVLFVAIVGPAAIGLAAVGDQLLLGKANNAAGKVTALVADLTGPVLQLTNKGSGPALELRVGNRPPFKVDSDARVANLNADKLDGKDAAAFVPANGPTYGVQNGMATGPSPSEGIASNAASCDSGDRILAGGFFNLSPNAEIAESFGRVDQWVVTIERIGNANATGSVSALCLDLPPLR